MKQIIIDKDYCIACSLCMALTNNLQSDEEGYPYAVSDVISDKELEQEMEKAASQCPQGAIKITNYDSNIGNTIEDLLYLLNEDIKNYQIPKIEPADIEFPFIANTSISTMPSMLISELSDNLYGNIYKSERQAQSAGEREFTNNRNRILKIVIRNWLSDYKTGVLNQFRIYEENEDNFYYRNIMLAEKLLKQLSVDCKNITGLDLPEEMLKIKTRAIWREDRNHKNSALDYLEDRLENMALENAEDASWYYDWINVDGDEQFWTVNVREANEQLAKHVCQSFRDAVGYRNIMPIIEETIGDFTITLQREMKEKAEEIIKWMQQNSQEADTLIASGDNWIAKIKQKKMERREAIGDYESMRQLISLKKIVKENIKPYSMDSWFSLELDLKELDGKIVKAGEVIATITQGKHIHNLSFNMGRPQPYGCGNYVNLKDSYPIVSEVNGKVHIFNSRFSEKDWYAGVIAHPNDKGDLRKWFQERK